MYYIISNRICRFVTGIKYNRGLHYLLVSYTHTVGLVTEIEMLKVVLYLVARKDGTAVAE
jgi:hypothetical protein